MQAILKFISRYLGRLRRAPTTSVAATNDTSGTLDFALLGAREQESVKQYFFAATNLMQLINGIRLRQRAVDVDTVLTNFRDAERSFIWAGMRPIFPPSVQCLTSFDPAQLISSGLLSRLEPSEQPVIYSPGMNRYVTKIINQFQPHEMDSTSFNPLKRG